jgi:ribosome-binding protein aMBF1 (putative translation factor)
MKHNEGNAMRSARKTLHMTQLDLSRQVGVTESLITKIETGRCTPDNTTKELIAKILGIKTWEIAP